MDKIICCPTYKRKSPRIFSLLEKYKYDVIHFCIRREEYESGFYKDWTKPNINFILLDNCTNIGNTRRKIIEYCQEQNIKYCMMLDDSVTDIISLTNEDSSLLDIFDDVIDEMTSDMYSERIAAVKIPVKKPRRNKKGERSYGSSIYRAFVIDVEKISSKNLNFEDSNDCGHEDFVFAYELHINGLFSIASERSKSKGRSCLPNRTEEGGTHSSADIQTIANEINHKSELSMQYLVTKYSNNKFFRPISIFTSEKPQYTIIFVHSFFKKEDMLKI